MWRVNPPTIDAGHLYQACVGGLRNDDLHTRLQLIQPEIERAYALYEQAGPSGLLHQFPLSDGVGDVTAQELGSIYDNRMVRLNSPGRMAYDAIMSATRSSRCPLCGHRRVSTLDHHLPQSRYAALSVAPLNLVPACKDCNFAKLYLIPADAERSTLHPYFDDVEAGRWLHAELAEHAPPAVRFWADPPNEWSPILRARVRHHFDTFKLGRLYAMEAADELRSIQYRVERLLTSAGADAVSSFLAEIAETCSHAISNWWRTVTYEVLSSSQWYCGGGFLETGQI